MKLPELERRMPIRLDGKALADCICKDLKTCCGALLNADIQPPRLTIVTDARDPASAVYINPEPVCRSGVRRGRVPER